MLTDVDGSPRHISLGNCYQLTKFVKFSHRSFSIFWWRSLGDIFSE